MKRIALLALCLLGGVAHAASVADSQVSCTTGGGILVGSGSGRISLCLYNSDTTNTAYFGPTGATTEFPLAPGKGLCIDASAGDGYGFTAESTIKCIGVGGTVVLGVHEGRR